MDGSLLPQVWGDLPEQPQKGEAVYALSTLVSSLSILRPCLSRLRGAYEKAFTSPSACCLTASGRFYILLHTNSRRCTPTHPFSWQSPGIQELCSQGPLCPNPPVPARLNLAFSFVSGKGGGDSE